MLDAQVVIGRFALVLLYGAIIGVEREARHKNAGIKTNTLVALGAAGFAMISNSFGPDNHNPAQLAAAVVTGIGFIGAGVIIHRGATVQGVTTAATLWVNAAVGVTVGTGHILVGTAMFAGVLLVQLTMGPIEKFIAERKARPEEITICVEASPGAVASINSAWREWSEQNSITVSRRSVTSRGLTILWTATFVTTGRPDIVPLQERLSSLPEVDSVEMLGPSEEKEGQ